MDPEKQTHARPWPVPVANMELHLRERIPRGQFPQGPPMAPVVEDVRFAPDLIDLERRERISNVRQKS